MYFSLFKGVNVINILRYDTIVCSICQLGSVLYDLTKHGTACKL